MDLGEVTNDQVHDPLACFDSAPCPDQRGGPDHQTVALCDRRREDQVEGAVLVLDQDEDHSIGGLRTLPGYL